MANQRQPTAERRRQIAEAALRIIGSKGIKHLTAAALGREVGIADATIFRHFRNKREIVLATVQHMQEVLFEGFPPKDPDPIARLRTFFLGRLEMVSARPELVQFTVVERLVEAAGAEGIARASEIMGRTRAFIVDCLREAQELGLVRRQLDPESLSICVLGALHLTAFLQTRQLAGNPVLESERAWETLEALLREKEMTPAPAMGAFD